ncbi:hypothetical protein Trydic_g19496 [Trypoxylus dichotomus]
MEEIKRRFCESPKEFDIFQHAIGPPEISSARGKDPAESAPFYPREESTPTLAPPAGWKRRTKRERRKKITSQSLFLRVRIPTIIELCEKSPVIESLSPAAAAAAGTVPNKCPSKAKEGPHLNGLH